MSGCKQCGKPLAYPGALYCGASCCARAEAHEPPTLQAHEPRAAPILMSRPLTAAEISALAEKHISPELRPGIEFVSEVADGQIVIGVNGSFRGKPMKLTEGFKLGDPDACNVEAVTRASRFVAEMTKRSR